jgi:RNA polymerase II-associated factor 1
MESDGDHFLAYYLTKDDESALEFKERRRDGAPPEPDEERKVSISLCNPWSHSEFGLL